MFASGCAPSTDGIVPDTLRSAGALRMGLAGSPTSPRQSGGAGRTRRLGLGSLSARPEGRAYDRACPPIIACLTKVGPTDVVHRWARIAEGRATTEVCQPRVRRNRRVLRLTGQRCSCGSSGGHRDVLSGGLDVWAQAPAPGFNSTVGLSAPSGRRDDEERSDGSVDCGRADRRLFGHTFADISTLLPGHDRTGRFTAAPHDPRARAIVQRFGDRNAQTLRARRHHCRQPFGDAGFPAG